MMQSKHGTGGHMTYRDASKWFQQRSKNTPMPGAREAYEMAAEALSCMAVLEDNKLMGSLISMDAVMGICERHENDVPDGGLALRIKNEVQMLSAVQMQKGDNAE
jgi:hypothetical protein